MDSPRFLDPGDRLRKRTSAPRRYPPNRWTIEETERRIVDEQAEWADVFDSSGRQLFRQRGTRQTVTFSTGDVPLLRDAIVVHNHPREEGERAEVLIISQTDLVFGVRIDIAEMRVVTTGWRFTLGRPREGWPVDESAMREVYDEEIVKVRAAFRRAVRLGMLSPEQALRRESDETLRRVAAWGQFVYLKEAI